LLPPLAIWRESPPPSPYNPGAFFFDTATALSLPIWWAIYFTYKLTYKTYVDCNIHEWTLEDDSRKYVNHTVIYLNILDVFGYGK
jgi:hypothetical protein